MQPFRDSWRRRFRRMEPRMATCPECEFDEIDTADYEEGDTFSCPECGKNLVLVGADEVEIADDEDEDEDLDDEDEDNDDLEDDDDEEEEDEDDLDDEDALDEEEDFDE
jgi:transcription initiation factor IIE alpha subunit